MQGKNLCCSVVSVKRRVCYSIDLETRKYTHQRGRAGLTSQISQESQSIETPLP